MTKDLLSSEYAEFLEDLKKNYKKGFSSRSLNYIHLFAESYPEIEFAQQAVAQLPACRAPTIAWK